MRLIYVWFFSVFWWFRTYSCIVVAMIQWIVAYICPKIHNMLMEFFLCLLIYFRLISIFSLFTFLCFASIECDIMQYRLIQCTDFSLHCELITLIYILFVYFLFNIIIINTAGGVVVLKGFYSILIIYQTIISSLNAFYWKVFNLRKNQQWNETNTWRKSFIHGKKERQPQTERIP